MGKQKGKKKINSAEYHTLSEPLVQAPKRVKEAKEERVD